MTFCVQEQEIVLGGERCTAAKRSYVERKSAHRVSENCCVKTPGVAEITTDHCSFVQNSHLMKKKQPAPVQPRQGPAGHWRTQPRCVVRSSGGVESDLNSSTPVIEGAIVPIRLSRGIPPSVSAGVAGGTS
jgi:hypothetical protein